MTEHQIFWPNPENPDPTLSVTDRLMYGVDAKRHPLGFVIEQGLGALPVQQQAKNFLRQVEQQEGKAAADAMRTKLAATERPLTIVK